MFLDLAQIREAYSGGLATPRALITSLRDQAIALNGDNPIFISLLDDSQLEPYFSVLEACDPASKPLYGVPFALKDNIDLAGIPTTAGCPAYAYTPTHSAQVVERLLALGAVPLGKTNLDQFATGLNGTRSPYGECHNSVVKDYISGGSSSGSAVSVAMGLVSFSLGTDTAGSGRVPAAMNGILGLKPSLGLLSNHGVVAACRSLDTISLFCREPADAALLLELLSQDDSSQPFSRRNALWNRPTGPAAAPFRFGVPRQQDLVWLGCAQGPALFERAVEQFCRTGGHPVEIDLRPFLEAAKMTYEGPWVAERYTAVGDFVESHQQQVHPVIKQIVADSKHWTAHQYFAAEARRRLLKRNCDQQLASVDFILTPTIPRAYTRAEMRNDPVELNSRLGIYTNFVNLLDYSAVAIPAGTLANDLPWGITIFGRSFTDQYLLGVAQNFLSPSPRPTLNGNRGDGIALIVCGAHLQGQPLNQQLLQHDAHLLRGGLTASHYRMYALPGGPTARPALVRDTSQGTQIEIEEWWIPYTQLGHFLAGIPAPLGLGKVELDDGRWEVGFIYDGSGLEGAKDITAFGGWRAYTAGC